MKGRVTAAYVFDREQVVFRDEDAANLNQLNFSFALIKDGAVSGDHWRNIEGYKAYIAKHPHILPVVSVGGWGAGGFSEAASSEAGRKRFVETTLSLVEKHGFLGVDIDWEYPCSSEAEIASSPEDKHNFSLLLEALRAGLDRLTAADGKQRLLAAAVGAAPELTENIECGAVGRIVDQLNLMTYDIQTRHVMSHATAVYVSDARYPKCADTAVKAYLAAGVPLEKMMIGCAFYARLFWAENGQATCFGRARTAGLDTKGYRALMAEPGWEMRFDETACASYAVKGDAFASFDTPRSILAKGAYVKKHGLQGVMCWEYGSDRDGELLAAMHEGVR